MEHLGNFYTREQHKYLFHIWTEACLWDTTQATLRTTTPPCETFKIYNSRESPLADSREREMFPNIVRSHCFKNTTLSHFSFYKPWPKNQPSEAASSPPPHLRRALTPETGSLGPGAATMEGSSGSGSTPVLSQAFSPGNRSYLMTEDKSNQG